MKSHPNNHHTIILFTTRHEALLKEEVTDVMFKQFDEFPGIRLM